MTGDMIDTNIAMAPPPSAPTAPEEDLGGDRKRVKLSPAGDNQPSSSSAPSVPRTSSGPQPPPPPKVVIKKSKAEREAERTQKEAERIEKARLAEERRLQKEEEKTRKEEERQRKEEEKARKEEERKQKEREREEQRQRKEQERQAKEAEKAAKEAEKAKKERSQMRLDFFVVGKKVEKPPVLKPDSDETVKQPAKSDYTTTFLPFELKPNMEVAPVHRFEKDAEAKEASKRRIDEALAHPVDEMEVDDIDVRRILFDALDLPPLKRKRGYHGVLPRFSTKDVLIKMQNEEATISLHSDHKKTSIAEYTRYLNSLPRKMIAAGQYRVPYTGTFTKIPMTTGLRSGRNPFQKALPNTNYDYDSEDEWAANEEEEGEDLLSGDEEEEEEEADDEIQDFLDDEEDPVVPKRRIVMQELDPVCTGLCWSENGRNPNETLDLMKMEVLLETELPIDPFKDYWSKPATVQTVTKQLATTMLPPSSGGPGRPRNKVIAVANAKLISANMMEDFKKAVLDSDDTKTGLIENLKKQFPKATKEAIKQTLEVIAVRVGKKWQLKSDAPV